MLTHAENDALCRVGREGGGRASAIATSSAGGGRVMLADISRSDSRYAAADGECYALPFSPAGRQRAMGGGAAAMRDAANPSYERIEVLVRSITLLAAETIGVEFVASDDIELPAFEAGAHVDLLLPNGIRRSYSLYNRPTDRHRYVVGVKKASPSRGASSYIHDGLRVGQRIEISRPRNNFPLVRSAARSIFIAGGIGITPIWSMIQTLEGEGAEWKLYYAARTSRDAAFLSELQALSLAHPGRIDIRFDHEPGVAMLDIETIVKENARPGVHFYACGPSLMLDAFEAATTSVPRPNRHLERFSADAKAASESALTEYEAVLAKSGMTLRITPEKSLLDTLLDAGVNVDFSCMEGICGSCRVAVREGLPDHRDHVLTDEERARNDTVLACCCSSRTQRLVLDL
jgi:tetrachlorobenzoquinone reductase